jgi:hypothetical protein
MKIKNYFLQVFNNNFQSAIFFFSFAVGPLSIFLSPESLTKIFVQTYSLSNFIFSLFWTLFFLAKNSSKNLYGIINLFLVAVLLINSLFGLNLIVWIYVFSIIMVDLSSSQINSVSIKLLNRLIPIFLLLLLILNLITFELFLFSRIFQALFFSLTIYFYKQELQTLKINQPLKFLLISFVFYSGTIILLSFMLSGISVEIYKILIITFQIGLVLLLKELDYKSRHNSNGGALLFKLTNYLSLLVLVIPLYLFIESWNFIILFSILLYLISYNALNYSKKYLTNE